MDAIQIGLALTAACLAAATTVVKARSEPIAPSSINTATFSGALLSDSQSGMAVRVKILLDQAGASPGAINNWDANELAHMASQGVTVEFRV